jgi:type I restriction enzyme S subunit
VNKIKPKIRFEGFDDTWEQRKLGELVDVYDGTHQTPNYTDKGVMFLSVENIRTLKSEKYILEEDFKKDFKVFPQKGDVLMTRIGDIGTANVVESNEPKAYYVSLALLKCKELNPYFLKESIASETVKNELWHRTLHIAFPKKINKNEIGKISIIYPESEEQCRIGEFFKNLDNLITLHQRKLDKMKNLKSAYLSKMFPKEGEKYPRLRFAGFTDAWEQRKLGELTNIKTGSSDLQDAVDNGEYPFFVRSENVERSNRYIFDGEAILIPGEGRLGDIYHYINGKFDYHQRVYKISDFADSNTDGKFVLYYLQQNFKRHALKFTVKATVDSLRLPMLVDFEIKLPNIDEQREVGVFFSNLDNLITLHQQLVYCFVNHIRLHQHIFVVLLLRSQRSDVGR